MTFLGKGGCSTAPRRASANDQAIVAKFGGQDLNALYFGALPEKNRVGADRPEAEPLWLGKAYPFGG